MRGEPQPQPDWTIDTYPEEIKRGQYVSNYKVEGGYARYRANVFDETGRLVGTGTKTEWSERFMDFAEKAETGAIARALAVCGFGTEAALDLDEGYEDDRVADAPVKAGRPIQITPSNVQGLVRGGRSKNITAAQFNEIVSLCRVLKVQADLAPLVENVTGRTIRPPRPGEHPATPIAEAAQAMSFEEAATTIRHLVRRRGNRRMPARARR